MLQGNNFVHLILNHTHIIFVQLLQLYIYQSSLITPFKFNTEDQYCITASLSCLSHVYIVGIQFYLPPLKLFCCCWLEARYDIKLVGKTISIYSKPSNYYGMICRFVSIDCRCWCAFSSRLPISRVDKHTTCLAKGQYQQMQKSINGKTGIRR